MNIGIGIGVGESYTASASKLVLVKDTFNRADSTTTLGTADTGQAWTNNAGALGISSNKAYMPAAGTSIATLDSTRANVVVQFTDSGIQEAALFNGVIVRYSDNNNYIRVVLQTTTLYVQRRQVGTTTTIGTTTIARVDGDIYRVVVDANGVTVYRNGANILTVPESFNATATRQGLIVSTTLARMDEFIVEAL